MILSTHLKEKKRASLDVFPAGQFSLNPSIIRSGDGYICVVGGVNYDREKIYYNCDWQANDRRVPISCRYKILWLNLDFHIIRALDLDTGMNMTDPSDIRYIEDLRLFYLGNNLMAIGSYLNNKYRVSSRRWVLVEQTYRAVVARIETNRLTNSHIFDSPTGNKREKNWIPCVQSPSLLTLITNINTGSQINVQYGQNTIITMQIGAADDFVWRDGWSGSSGFVPYRNGYLAIVHRASARPLLYKHMFIFADRNLSVIRRSDIFSFDGICIEFCCGLSIDEDNDRIVVSYGQFDKAAVVVEFALSDVERMINLDVSADTGLRDVNFEHDIPLSQARRCVIEHEDLIWDLISELAEAQARIDALSTLVNK